MDQNNDDRGIDLSHALDDSSRRIKFEGEEFQRPRSFQAPTSGIVEWIIKYSGGVIKDEKQAQYVLIGFVAVAIIISIFLVSGGSSLGRSGKTPIPAGQNIPHTFSE
jgi:hypothetical protein